MGLLLTAVEAGEPLKWRWLLTDEATGELLADHQVDLDPACDEVAALGDLYGYARWRAAPDRRAAEESRIMERAGAWAGRALLGEKTLAAIVAASPVTVRVSLPAELEAVSWWPIELAHAGEEPLAARGDVPLVYDVGSPPGRPKAEISGALRVLAVFSQPANTGVVALRRARYSLNRQIRGLAARNRALVELRVVQYGVTRERLAAIAESGDGWDVLQLWGHGGPGTFVLEHADGSPDPVSAGDLVRLLAPARHRVKLAVVAACESAAAVTAHTLRLVGLPEQAERVEAERASGSAVTGLARALVHELDCAVVAMRYPVTDEFAIAFAGEFFERLLNREQPADVAAARAVTAAAGATPSAARPAVSLVTPGLFGARAAGLRLAVPRGNPRLDPAEAAMAYFPPEPERFVGRAAAMAAANAALASGSGHTAVLLHGMAGAGKTACALELAYRHQDVFGAVAFWQAPTRDDEFEGALANLAIALETQLGGYGFTMTGHLGTTEALTAFLPRLRRILETNGLLLVLDNLETLLTPDGNWRDPRWEPVVAALTGHGGTSRLVLTSRVPPTGLAASVLTLPVHALSLEEAAALARELPNLRGLLHADGPETTTADADRDRVRRVLRVVQGHPKLLELADAAAAAVDRLDAQLSAAESAAMGHGLDAFFRDGTSTLDPDQFLDALSGWTVNVLNALPEPARLMAGFVACLEDDDRQSGIIDATWPELWRHLGRPGDSPDSASLLGVLADAALVEPDAGEAGVAYRMHPGVAAAIGTAAEPGTRDAADAVLAAFWRGVAQGAAEWEGGEVTALVVRAGLAAAPYLLRRRDWDTAAWLLERALVRDESPGLTQAALPALHRIAAATGAPADTFVLARALRRADPARAEPLLRDSLDRAIAAGDYRLASAIAGDLAGLLLDGGRLRQALHTAEQGADYTIRAGLGPWTRLADQERRLRILAAMGEHDQVLAETAALRDQMRDLPDRRAAGDPVNPWNVRETILGTGRSSALALGHWQQCLDLNAEILTSKRERGAGPHELASTRFNDAAPLRQLGRLAEAARLLAECQQVFEDHRDTPRLALVLSERATLANALGHRDAGTDLARAALRLCYAAAAGPRDIAASHHNLASHLDEIGADPAGQRAHRLAAAILRRLTGMTHDLARTQRALAGELHDDTDAVPLPHTLAEVIEVTGRTDGVRLGELITALEPDPAAAEEALAQILRDAALELPRLDLARPPLDKLHVLGVRCRVGRGRLVAGQYRRRVAFGRRQHRGQHPSRRCDRHLARAADERPQHRELPREQHRLPLAKRFHLGHEEPVGNTPRRATPGQHQPGEPPVVEQRGDHPLPGRVTPVAVRGEQLLDTVDDNQHGVAFGQLGEDGQARGRSDLAGRRHPRHLLVERTSEGPQRPDHPAGRDVVIRQRAERVLVPVRKLHRARGLPQAGRPGEHDPGAALVTEHPGRHAHQVGTADEKPRLVREKCHGRRGRDERRGGCAEPQVRAPAAEQRGDPHRQRRHARPGVVAQGLRQRELERPGQRLAGPEQQRVEVVGERDREVVIHGVAHREHPAVELAGRLLGQRGQLAAVQVPGQRGGIARREHQQLEPGAAGPQQADQLGRRHDVLATGRPVENQAAGQPVPGEVHDVPARAVLQRVAQPVAAHVILEHGQVDRLAVPHAEPVHDRDQRLALLAQDERRGDVRQAERGEHAEVGGDRVLRPARRCFRGGRCDQADILDRERQSVDDGQFPWPEHQGAGLLRKGDRHRHRRPGHHRRPDRAERCRPDPPSYPFDDLRFGVQRGLGGDVQPEVAVQPGERGELRAGRVELDVVVGDERSVAVRQRPVPAVRRGVTADLQPELLHRRSVVAAEQPPQLAEDARQRRILHRPDREAERPLARRGALELHLCPQREQHQAADREADRVALALAAWALQDPVHEIGGFFLFGQVHERGAGEVARGRVAFWRGDLCEVRGGRERFSQVALRVAELVGQLRGGVLDVQHEGQRGDGVRVRQPVDSLGQVPVHGSIIPRRLRRGGSGRGLLRPRGGRVRGR
jgi:hypothetical protein